MEVDNLIYQVLTSDDISEVIQYNFYLDKFTVSTRQFEMTKNEDDWKGISGIYAISNTFKVMKIKRYKDIGEIG